jgi:hypothetical protein
MSFEKTAACMALTLMSGVSAADWQLVGSNGKEFSLFADLDTKRRSNNIVTLSEMVSYGDAQTIPSVGKRYLSEKSQVDYDCTGRRARVVVSEKYSGDRGSGSVVQRDSAKADSWMPIPSRTNMEKLWNLACERI